MIAPGSDCGKHTTGAHEQVLVVMDGCDVAKFGGGSTMTIRGGQAVYIPPHTTHNIVNTSGWTLRYIYVVAPIVEG
ncbi:MAG: cupin domain-containing protein [Planctomycetota bacterium]